MKHAKHAMRPTESLMELIVDPEEETTHQDEADWYRYQHPHF